LETKITLADVKEITLSDIQYYPLEDFLTAKGVPNAMLGWIDGLLFTIGNIPLENEMMVTDLIDGIHHWASFDYTHLKKHTPTVLTKDNFAIPVLNQSTNRAIKIFVMWLKERSYYVKSAKPLTASVTSN